MTEATFGFLVTLITFAGLLALSVRAAMKHRRRRPELAENADGNLADTSAAVTRSFEKRFHRAAPANINADRR